MNTLTTRKIVLGMLMTLVLAFSVQGTADAITSFTRGSGDLLLYAPGDDFRISFTPRLQNRVVIDPAADPIDYYYDDESINITVLNANIRKVGSFDITPAASHTMNEQGTNATRLSGSVTLTLRADAAEVVAITITDTSDANRPGTAVDALPLVFTVYIAPEHDDTSTITSPSADVDFSIGEEQVNDDFAGLTNVRVNYTVSGSGSVYVKTDNNTGSRSKNLTTSSAAPVYLDMGGSTNKVTASIVGQRAERAESVTYIYSHAVLSKVSGDTQRGATGARLANPLVVKVVDGRNRNVSGVPINFTATGGGNFLADSNFPSDLNVDADTVRTNSAGVANIFWVLGGTATDAQSTSAALANATAIQANTVTFTATFGTATSTPSSIVIESGDGQSADEFGLLEDPLVVVVRDQRGQRMNDATVTFLARDGGTLDVPGSDDPGTPAAGGTDTDTIKDIATNTSGQASVRYTPPEGGGRRTVSASISGGLKSVTFTINGTPGTGTRDDADDAADTAGPGARLVAVPSPVTGAPGSTPSITISAVDANNNPVPGAPITLDPFSSFISAGGSYSSSSGNSPFALTLTLPTTTGSYSFSAGSLGYTGVSITVTVGGTAAPGASPTLVAQQTSISGTPSSLQRVVATARDTANNPVEDVPVTFTIVGFDTRTVDTDAFGTAAWSFNLPSTVGPYTLNITAPGGYETATVPVTVSTTGAPPPTITGVRLLRSDGNNQTGEPGTRLAEPLVVTVVDGNNLGVDGRLVQFSVTSGGGRVSPSSATTNASGQAQTRLTLGRTAGTNTVVATLNGVSVTFTATAELAPAYLEVYDGNNQRGTLNNELADPLVVQVLDDNEDGVADVRVDFRVTSGSARLSQRGTGNAVRVFTDRNGMAEASITPTGAGPITVRATANGLDPVEFTITTGPPPASLTIVSGNNQAGTPGNALANPLIVEVQDAEGGAVDGVMVTFEVTAGGGTLSAETATTDAHGRAQTSLTLGSEREINSVRASVTGLDAVTFNTSVDAVIHVAASNRPVMYWIDGGALYHLAGAKAQQIAASANDVAVDMTNGKIYWIEGTSDRTGTIHSANVDGTGAAVVKELTSVPMGLALDSANGKLYLTNSWGKIQRMNVDGSQFETNLFVGLGAPMDIAVASGKVYWTDAAGSVRSANTEGTKVIRNIATGSGALGGIAAGSNKVYWTEQTGNITGRIRSANLDGTGVADLFALTAVPAGIAVDGNTVYWANGWGKVQRRNLDGSQFQDLVTGLMSPGAVAVGGANVATPTPTQTPQPGTTAKSQYDVNGDGTVDNVDAALVAGASGTNNAAYDVNGDGLVNFLDLLLVFDNRDAGAAGAPTVVPTQLTAVQVDRIQEQIDLLRATNDRSPVALYTLQYLQSLLASARPGKTQLLANYPNPFNPETWIPYELATDTNVKVTIYDAQGIVVRTLSIGHQSAGYYTSRDRAAYWDGRNSFGELVASGLYFYQLETDEASLMRKMVILK